MGALVGWRYKPRLPARRVSTDLMLLRKRDESLRPGARHRQTVWHDQREPNTVWMMGGEGHDATGQNGWLDDIWRLHLPDAGSGTTEVQWEWAGGSAISAGYAPPLQWGPTG